MIGIISWFLVYIIIGLIISMLCVAVKALYELIFIEIKAFVVALVFLWPIFLLGIIAGYVEVKKK